MLVPRLTPVPFRRAKLTRSLQAPARVPIVRGMSRWIALIALLLAACATETRYVEAADQDDTWLRDGAAEAWAGVGIEAPEYTLLFLDPGTLLDACNAEAPEVGTVGGCSFPGVVLLNRDADPDLQLQNLTHELGHLMRPHRKADELDHRHLDCPEFNGADVMCATGAPVGTMPTVRDAVFVRAR